MTASDHKELCERLRKRRTILRVDSARAIEALVRERDVWRECCNKISNRMIRPHSRSDIMDLVREANGPFYPATAKGRTEG